MEIKEKKAINEKYDVAVIGGGLSGVCAAIASARHGANTVLVQNRPVLGGNASSEIRMHICGASVSGMRDNARETGIVEEILLENRLRNFYDEFEILDVIMWEKARFQENLTLHMNTHMNHVETKNNKIISVSCDQLTSETEILIDAEYFIDATGDGTLGAYAGAEYMRGSESKDEFGEPMAPEKGDDYTMGNTILFKARDTGRKCRFIKPFWAHDVTEEMLAARNHTNLSYGYWWIELGGMGTDTVKDYEYIKDELMKWAFGIWDHIKNKGDHGADNYELVWIGALPGKRESRRLAGDYVLKAQDLLEGRIFDDAVAYGGWPMDMHVPGGLEAPVDEPTEYFHLDDMYTIPYKCLYSKNIKNLFLAGRAISCSKLAFGSIRVMATTGVIGQAAGTAAALAAEKGIEPRKLNESIRELQRKLLNDDAYLHGYKFHDEDDLVRESVITCSSQRHPCENIKNGHTRNIGENINYWESGTLHNGQFIKADFKKEAEVREVQLRFDSNLTREIRPSMSYWATNSQVRGVPGELVKDYTIELINKGEIVALKEVTGNYHRLNKLFFDSITADSIRITVTATNGWSTARIFDIKAY
jgi:hypothetical protein